MKRLAIQLAALVTISFPALAGTINYTCASTGPGAVNSSVCTILKTTIAGQYAAIFTNANAFIYVDFGNIGDDVASNNQILNTVSYSSYYNALASHEQDANDATAVASLGGGTTNPVASGGVALTSALDSVLGFSSQAYGVTPTGAECNSIQGPKDGCYNDVITASTAFSFYFDGITSGSQTNSEYDFFTAVEHETDEALGTESCLANGVGALVAAGGCDNGPNNVSPFTNIQGVSPADLFRYACSGVRSYADSVAGCPGGTTTLAYFSINGGVTDIAPYNNTTVGDGDYGDWSTPCTYVQDVDGCIGSGAGLNIENDGGAEIKVLDAVGYTVGAPEPGTIAMALGGLGAVALVACRRRRNAHASQRG